MLAGCQWLVSWDEKATLALGLTYTFLYIANADVDHVGLPPSNSVILDGTYDPDFANIIGLTLASHF